MNKKTKLILFDWGNIVESHNTGYSCPNAWDDLLHQCGYTGNKIIFKEIGKYKLDALKNINEWEQTYKQIANDFNLNTNFEKFITLYKKIFDKIDYYEDVAKYQSSLKNKCYIGIFSNLSIFDKERLDKQVNLSNYDYIFLSYEFGIRKPEKLIFEKINKDLPFNPKNILFIDDKKENVEAALNIGWNAFQATGLELDKIKQTCDNFLNK